MIILEGGVQSRTSFWTWVCIEIMDRDVHLPITNYQLPMLTPMHTPIHPWNSGPIQWAQAKD